MLVGITIWYRQLLLSSIMFVLMDTDKWIDADSGWLPDDPRPSA